MNNKTADNKKKSIAEREQLKAHKKLTLQMNKRIREKGMNKSKLAREAGVETPAVYRFLDPESNPTFKSAFKFAAALGCTLKIELVPLGKKE